MIRLLARIYEVLPLSCPDCGAEVRILALLTDPLTVAGILRHIGLPTSLPPDEPAYDTDPLLDLDKTAARSHRPDPTPDIDFDQTLGA